MLDTLPSSGNDDCGIEPNLYLVLLFLPLSPPRNGDSFRVTAYKYLHTELIPLCATRCSWHVTVAII